MNPATFAFITAEEYLRDGRLPGAGPGPRDSPPGRAAGDPHRGRLRLPHERPVQPAPPPAEVVVDGDTATLVRRRETFDDLVATEVNM